MIKAIFIECGHGHGTTGAIDNGASFGVITERDLVLSIGNKLYSKFAFQNKISRKLIDEKFKLTSKIQYINEVCKLMDYDATNSILLSLHCNSSTSTQANGIETYTIKDWKDGLGYGNKILNNLNISTGMKIRGAKYDDQSQHNRLAIVQDTKPLAILVELGFGSNKDDLNILMNKQDLIVEGLYNGLAEICGFEKMKKEDINSKATLELDLLKKENAELKLKLENIKKIVS